jgi:hypothetical protein
MQVKVYYNLRKQCLSVMDKATRRVIKHVQNITLGDVKFSVSKKGVERIRRNKRKAVVAFVEGRMIECDTICVAPELGWHAVSFNPYKHNSFVLRDTQTKIDSSSYATILGREVFAFEPQ